MQDSNVVVVVMVGAFKVAALQSVVIYDFCHAKLSEHIHSCTNRGGRA